VRSELNRDTPLVRPGEFRPLRLGDHLTVDPPVVLAPMAGVTNAPYRTLCRELSDGRCLYVSEMITALSFAMGHSKTLRLASFSPAETTRSIQLYGTHPDSLAAATRILVGEWGVHHIDINLGCPVRKITANGGGSAIPARPRLMARLVSAVVDNAGAVPVTVKFRKGIDDDVLTFLDAGRVAEEVGCAAVALHARTAAEFYSGAADWNAIGELKAAVRSIPVLGNGDVFEAFDALRMMRQTGCDGVVVGRGCLGRPWLFRELCEVFDGVEPADPPDLGAIADLIRRHADLLAEYCGETIAMRELRKFLGWYTKSFPGLSQSRRRLQLVASRAELESLLAALPAELPFPAAGLRVKRAKSGARQKVVLPPGFLEDRNDDRPLFPDPLDAGGLSGG
jgi:nifR3 family TIM-barrel protein